MGPRGRGACPGGPSGDVHSVGADVLVDNEGVCDDFVNLKMICQLSLSYVLIERADIRARGAAELRLLYFLRRLSISAAAQGGALLPILGNHEVMNVSGDFRFVTPQGLQEFSGWAGWSRAGLAIKRRCGGLEQPKNPFLGVPKAFPGIKREFWDGIRSRLAALRPDGPIARRFLADLPTVLVVGDSVFVHGGLLEANVEYGLERINAEVSDWIRGEHGNNARAPEYVCGRDAVVWLRRFSEGFNCDCQRLQGVLGMIPGAKRMVMGHTIQSEGINAVCGAQAVRVDVGLSRGCGNGLPEVLEINGGGSDVRVITTDPTEAWQYRKQKPEKSATALEKKGEVEAIVGPRYRASYAEMTENTHEGKAKEMVSQIKSTYVIRQLNKSNAKLRAEHDLLRAKIVGSAEQQEQTTALLKRTGVIVEKLMDENNKLRIERRRLVEESVDARKQHLEDKKELVAARAETSSRGLPQCIKKRRLLAADPSSCCTASLIWSANSDWVLMDKSSTTGIYDMANIDKTMKTYSVLSSKGL
ncbi:hypothetical protein TRIUR3_27212 [Triticum urartu]|uniref:Calcineurin-like phosphoesterase domain-containing protein n=1 Tax=Triticum urartu TaxID=4572 RepID=M8AUF3_TRIUA|nr:hypothetical protein TRIUR3_27212 [Triticum urartu]